LLPTLSENESKNKDSIQEANIQKMSRREALKEMVVDFIQKQGFTLAPYPTPNGTEKELFRKIHEQKRIEQLKLHRKFLLSSFKTAKSFSSNLSSLRPDEIELDLIEVKPNSLESRLFFWWNLVWWSLPFDKPIGRQMKFMLWDKAHDAPFGLVGLQSPPLRSGVRDKFLGLSGSETDYWVNQSMYAQRVGALPPYNELLGGKMVALSLVSNEIRDRYQEKYANSKTLLRKRELPSSLLFVTTSSAYGKSSMYDRLYYGGKRISHFIGFTSGSGTFHISESLYRELLRFLEENGGNVKLGYGTGSSRKLRLVDKAFRMLGLPKFTFHGIKRGYYFFPNVANVQGVLHQNEKPIWFDRPFKSLFEHWRQRWAVPRSARTSKWENFDPQAFFEETKVVIETL
jgi:hypothetical protein